MTQSRKSMLFIGALALSLGIISSCTENETYNVPALSDHGVTVQATGTVEVVPDAVQFNFSVFAVQPTSQLAVEATTRSAENARQALISSDVNKDDFSTQNVTVYPEYTYDQTGKQSLNGFRATQFFAVTIKQTSAAGQVVDAVVGSVGTDLQIDSVSPFVIDTTSAIVQARALAVDTAKAKAKAYAELLDVDLGGVIYVDEVNAPSTSPQYLARDMATYTEKSATVVDLGKQQVTVTINVRWSIGN